MRKRGTPSAPSRAYLGQQGGIGLALPASLGAPCPDTTDCHAAHDAHEVLACQVAECDRVPHVAAQAHQQERGALAPRCDGSGEDDYLANVMPVMQRFVTVIAVLPENTSTLTLSIFEASAAAKTPVGVVL